MISITECLKTEGKKNERENIQPLFLMEADC